MAAPAGLRGASFSGPCLSLSERLRCHSSQQEPILPLSADKSGSRGGCSEHAQRGALMAARQMQMDRMAADSGGTARIDPAAPQPQAGRTRPQPLLAAGETAAAITLPITLRGTEPPAAGGVRRGAGRRWAGAVRAGRGARGSAPQWRGPKDRRAGWGLLLGVSTRPAAWRCGAVGRYRQVRVGRRCAQSPADGRARGTAPRRLLLTLERRCWCARPMAQPSRVGTRVTLFHPQGGEGALDPRKV